MHSTFVPRDARAEEVRQYLMGTASHATLDLAIQPVPDTLQDLPLTWGLGELGGTQSTDMTCTSCCGSCRNC